MDGSPKLIYFLYRKIDKELIGKGLNFVPIVLVGIDLLNRKIDIGKELREISFML